VPGNSDDFYKGDGVGVVWALDAATGEQRWSFNTVPEDLWDAKHKDINSGGGLWHTPAFDSDGNLYFSVANPAPWPGTNKYPWATSRPGNNKHTNSLVKLDAKTGALRWANQVLPGDLYDWDLHLPPVLASNGGKPVVLTGGKMGYVYAIDPQSGKTLWKRAVGKHNGHDNDNQLALAGKRDELPKLPVTVYPGALGGVETQLAVNDTTVFAPVVDVPITYQTQEKTKLDVAHDDGHMVALDIATGEIKWDRKFDSAVYGAATVVNDLVFTTTFDGRLLALDTETGATVWEDKLPAGTNAPVAVAGDTLLTAASYPQGKGQRPELIAYRIDAKGAPAATPEPSQQTNGGGGASGEDVFASNCGSCHTLAAAGSSGTTGPDLDDLKPDSPAVERQVTNGGGGMPSFGGRLSKDEIKAVADYVASSAGKGGGGGDDGGGGGP
jgi:outer membrane protein assembly factor BamB